MEALATNAAYSTAQSVTGVDMASVMNVRDQIAQVDELIKRFPDAANREQLESMRADLAGRLEASMEASGQGRNAVPRGWAAPGDHRRDRPGALRRSHIGTEIKVATANPYMPEQPLRQGERIRDFPVVPPMTGYPEDDPDLPLAAYQLITTSIPRQPDR